MKNFIWPLLFSVIPYGAFAKPVIATTTTDLSAIVKEVGQDRVETFSIAKGTQDAHLIEAKPSYMVKLRSADLVIAQGLELETAWLDPLIQGARNPKLADPKNIFSLGPKLDPLDVSKGPLSRAQGDVHPGGNPHFQLDPIRLGQAAVLIADRLGDLDPSQKDFFSKNAETFQKRMAEKTKEWQSRIKKTGISEIITYHKTLTYFCARFDIKCNVQLEPKPGIPPTASHILSVIEQMKKRNIRLVLIENLYDDSIGSKLRQQVPNALIEKVPVSVGGEAEIRTNEQLIERLVKVFETEGK